MSMQYACIVYMPNAFVIFACMFIYRQCYAKRINFISRIPRQGTGFRLPVGAPYIPSLGASDGHSLLSADHHVAQMRRGIL